MSLKYPQSDHKLSIINTVERPYLTWLDSGIKTAEGRVNAQKCRQMNLQDTILLFNNVDYQYIYGTIAFKHEYPSFEEMLVNEGVKNMLPFLNDGDLEKGIEVYNSFPGSSRVLELGCVAIGISVITSKL